MKIGIDLNLRQNELQNGVFQNLVAAPENPKLGQFYFDTTLGKYGVYEGVVGEEHWAYYATVDDLQNALDNLGTMAYEDKNDYYTKQDIVDHFWSNNDKTLATGHFRNDVQGPNGKAILWNEEDGGGAKFEHNDGLWSYVGTNDGGKNGLAGQIYALEKVNNKYTGSRIDVTKDGMYYTVGNASLAERDVAANEIATHGVVDAEAQARQQADEALKQEVLSHLWNNKSSFDTGYFQTEASDTNGTAKIWNEVDGGGIQHNSAAADGDTVFVGVHGDDQVGEFVSIYAKDKSDATKTKRVIVKTDGAYYLKSNGIVTTADDEIATVGTISGSVAAEEARAKAAEQALDDKIGIEQGRAEAAEAALDEAKADKATTLAGYNIQDAYTKAEVDAKMSSAFHYKGSVDYYDDLPEYGNVEGDVWNIKYADPDHGVDAGDNVVWVELEESDESGLSGYWDVLAGIMDLSAYAKKTEVQAVQQELTEFKINLKVVEFNPEIEVGASGYATWTIPHTHGEDVVVAVKEVSTKEEILANITQNNNSVTIGINAEPNTILAANTYKAIIIG